MSHGQHPKKKHYVTYMGNALFRQENHCSTLNSHSYYALLPKGIDNKLRITNIVAHNRNSYYTLSPKGFANKLRITNSEVNILCMNE